MQIVERTADSLHQLRICDHMASQSHHGYFCSLVMTGVFATDQFELQLHRLGRLADQALGNRSNVTDQQQRLQSSLAMAHRACEPLT